MIKSLFDKSTLICFIYNCHQARFNTFQLLVYWKKFFRSLHIFRQCVQYASIKNRIYHMEKLVSK